MASSSPAGMPDPPRATYDADTLLAVAAEVFAERGYDGTSMGELARAAGISKSSTYHHVPGKEALLSRALDRAVSGLAAVFDEPEAVTGRAHERLRHVVRRSVEVLIAELPYVRLLLRLRGNSAIEVAALERRRELDHAVAHLVAAAIAEGDLRADLDPHLTARLIFGTVNSVAEWYRPHPNADSAAVTDAVVAVVEVGITGASGSRR